MKFKKKPIVIEAIQFDGTNGEEIEKFTKCVARRLATHTPLMIVSTYKGDVQARTGDWIIKGVKGEFYPCKPDIFEETYDKIGSKPESIISVSVRWFDGYLEEFVCGEVRFGSDLLWVRLSNGKNRHIPTRQVRWYSITPESHEKL